MLQRQGGGRQRRGACCYGSIQGVVHRDDAHVQGGGSDAHALVLTVAMLS